MASAKGGAGRASHNRADRQLRRLLRALAGQGAAGARCEMPADEAGPDAKARVIFTGATGPKTFDCPVLREAIAEALVLRAGERLRISKLGVAHLKRMLAAADPFPAQHRRIERATIKTDTGPQEVRVNLAESPLTRLFARKRSDGSRYIDDTQLQAGERLRRDFERGRLSPSVSARWEGSVARAPASPDAGLTITEIAMDARKRVDKAMAALGPDLCGVALDVCCFLKGLEAVERERGWPPRSAKLMLRTALSMLARHYGITAGDDGVRPMRQWGTPDFRPSLDGGE